LIVFCCFSFVVITSASDCLEDRLQNDLYSVEQDVKPYSCLLCLFSQNAVLLGMKIITRVLW